MMRKKLLYEVPRTEVLEMDYAEPVCVLSNASGSPQDYDVIDDSDIDYD